MVFSKRKESQKMFMKSTGKEAFTLEISSEFCTVVLMKYSKICQLEIGKGGVICVSVLYDIMQRLL